MTDKQALRRDITATRDHLGETVSELAAKTDVKARAKGAVRDATALAKENTQLAVDRAAQFVERQPGRWAAIVGGTVVAALGVLMMRKRRRRHRR